MHRVIQVKTPSPLPPPKKKKKKIKKLSFDQNTLSETVKGQYTTENL